VSRGSVKVTMTFWLVLAKYIDFTLPLLACVDGGLGDEVAQLRCGIMRAWLFEISLE
jgi:hypothetical protein